MRDSDEANIQQHFVQSFVKNHTERESKTKSSESQYVEKKSLRLNRGRAQTQTQTQTVTRAQAAQEGDGLGGGEPHGHMHRDGAHAEMVDVHRNGAHAEMGDVMHQLHHDTDTDSVVVKEYTGMCAEHLSPGIEKSEHFNNDVPHQTIRYWLPS